MIISTPSYNIISGKEWARRLNSQLEKKKYTQHFILCDENTLQHCLPILVTSCPALAAAQIIEIEAGEQSKSIEIAVNIWHTLSEHKADRHSLLVNLGGGVVTDLGGFCASVYKRGIPFINIPTSLLGMADASVGGKTGVDFAGIKNLLGTFKTPDSIFINQQFLTTLHPRHFNNGLAEIFKIALVSDKRFWESLKKGWQKMSAQSLTEKSILLKKKIVQKDPDDNGIRQILNFGHTVGHAIESISSDKPEGLLHGEAVLVGMIIESHIAWQKKMISKKVLEEIENTLSPLLGKRQITLPSQQEIIEQIRNDKKAVGGKLQFSLIKGIGSCKPKVEVTSKQLEVAVGYYTKRTK